MGSPGGCGRRMASVAEYRSGDHRHFSAAPEAPPAFDGFRIAHIADLHNARFGPGHCRLLAQLRAAKPDLIAITGDMIDARRTDLDCALQLARAAVDIAPCFYVMGNHEARIPAYPKFEQGLLEAGVQVLRNREYSLERNGAWLSILGIDDPAATEGFQETLQTLSSQARGFRLLLSHRPERFEAYCAAHMDVVLCGHTHGGQVRIPFLGGIIAPHQGFFPDYDSGVYTDGDTSMIISRGLGNSLCPLRVNDPPELVLAELHCSPSSHQ